MTENISSNPVKSISLALQAFSAGIILVVLSQLGLSIGGTNFQLVFIPVASILFWPDKASRRWSLIFVFLIGLLQDILNFGPMGMMAFCYLLLFIVRGPEFKLSPGLGSATGMFFLSTLFLWLPLFILGRLYLGSWPPWLPLATASVVSTLVFPLIYSVRSLLQIVRAEPTEREAR